LICFPLYLPIYLKNPICQGNFQAKCSDRRPPRKELSGLPGVGFKIAPFEHEADAVYFNLRFRAYIEFRYQFSTKKQNLT
jgi:hypothetical protein